MMLLFEIERGSSLFAIRRMHWQRGFEVTVFLALLLSSNYLASLFFVASSQSQADWRAQVMPMTPMPTLTVHAEENPPKPPKLSHGPLPPGWIKTDTSGGLEVLSTEFSKSKDYTDFASEIVVIGIDSLLYEHFAKDMSDAMLTNYTNAGGSAFRLWDKKNPHDPLYFITHSQPVISDEKLPKFEAKVGRISGELFTWNTHTGGWDLVSQVVSWCYLVKSPNNTVWISVVLHPEDAAEADSIIASFNFGESQLKIEKIDGGIYVYVDTQASGKIFRRGQEKPAIMVNFSKDYENLIEADKAYLEIDILRPGEMKHPGGLIYVALKNVTVAPPFGRLGEYAFTWDYWDWTGDWDGNHPNQDQKLTPSETPIGIYKVLARVINRTDHKTLAVSEEEKLYIIFDWDSALDDLVGSPCAYLFHNYPYCTICNLLGSYRYAYVLHQYDPQILDWAMNSISEEHLNNIKMGKPRRPATRVVDAANTLTIITKNLVQDPEDILGWNWAKAQYYMHYYDTLKALSKTIVDVGGLPVVPGTCVDSAGVETALLRAVGIPSRILSISAVKYTEGQVAKKAVPVKADHASVEVWYDGRWNFYDPSWGEAEDNQNLYSGLAYNAKTSDVNTYKVFPENGYFEYPGGYTAGYWAVSHTDGSGDKVENVYKRYSWLANITDLDAQEKHGQLFVTFKVKNVGLLDITRNLGVTVCYYYTGRPGKFNSWEPALIHSADKRGPLKPGEYTPKTTVYGFVWTKIQVQAVFVNLYYYSRSSLVPLDCKVVPLGSKPLKAPNIIPSVEAAGLPTSPQIKVNGQSTILDNFELSTIRPKGDRTQIICASALNSSLVEAVSESSPNLPYTKTTFSVTNVESKRQNIVFTIPVLGLGDTIYTSGAGTISGNTVDSTKLNNYLAIYSSKEGINGNVSMLASPKPFKIVEVTQDESGTAKTVFVEWETTLEPGERGSFIIYEADKSGAGADAESIYSQLSKEIVENGDSMLDIEVQSLQMVRPSSRATFTIAAENRGVVEETLGYALNISRRLVPSDHEDTLLSQTDSVKIGPGASVSIPVQLDIEGNTPSNIFNIILDTLSGDTYRKVVSIESLLNITAPRQLTAKMGDEMDIKVVLKNTGESPASNVTITVEPYGNFRFDKDSSRRFSELKPGSQEELTWTVTPTGGGTLPFTIQATSDNGGTTSTLIEIVTSSPGQQPPPKPSGDGAHALNLLGDYGSAILVIIVIVAVAVVVMRRRGRAAPSPTPPTPARPVPPPTVTPPPPPPPQYAPQPQYAPPSREKFCINCGSPIPSTSKYCGKCGAEQQ